MLRTIENGLLVQEWDAAPDPALEWTLATERDPSREELRDLAFAWEVCRSVKSNAIVLAKDRAVLGVGSGQPNRLESVRIAVSKAGELSEGSVLASDAFFPFADGPELAFAAGVTAVAQPG